MSQNTLIHRVVRVAMRPLVGTFVTPNHLTALRLATGLGAAAAFAVGAPEWRAWGGALFVVSILLDRADGELARLGGQTSSWGHRFDLVSDAVSNTAAFIGLGIGLRDGALGPWAVVMGAVAGAAVSAAVMLMLRIEELEGERASQVESVAGFDPDDALLLVPVFIWIGWAEPMIVLACVGAPAFVLYMYVRFRPLLRRAGN